MFQVFSRHYQELNDCSGGLWFYLSYRGDSRAVFMVGPAGRQTVPRIQQYRTSKWNYNQAARRIEGQPTGVTPSAL